MVSVFGLRITVLAMPLVAVLALDATEFQVGLLFSLNFLAFLLIGLPAGVWVDRLRRRPVLIVCDVSRACLLLTIPLAWAADVLTLGQLYAVALLVGAFTVFFDVAYLSYLPQLVGRCRLVEANAKLASVDSVSRVAGPGLAGYLIQLLSAPAAIAVNAVALGLSAIFVARIRRPEDPPQRSERGNLLGEIWDGLRFLVGHRLLRPIAACTAIYNLFWSAYAAMLVVFLARDLELREGLIGVVFGIFGVGGVLGAMVARRFASWVGHGPAIWMSMGFAAPFALLFPLLARPGPTVWVAALGQLVVVGGAVVYNVAQASLLQTVTPDHLLGRTNATMRFLVWGVVPAGGVVGGLLGEWFGTRVTLWTAAIGVAVAFLPVVRSPLRTMRTLPEPPEPESAEPEPAETEPAGLSAAEPAAAPAGPGEPSPAAPDVDNQGGR